MKHLILGSLLLLCAGIGMAQQLQQQQPVQWTFSVIEEDDHFLWQATATIEKNWNVYSQFLEEGGPVPTSVFLSKVEGITWGTDLFMESGPHFKEGHDEIFDMTLGKFSESLVLTRAFRVTGKKPIIEGGIEYMTCDDERCLPPVTIPFKWSK